MRAIIKWFGFDGYTLVDAVEDAGALVALALFFASIAVWWAIIHGA